MQSARRCKMAAHGPFIMPMGMDTTTIIINLRGILEVILFKLVTL